MVLLYVLLAFWVYFLVGAVVSGLAIRMGMLPLNDDDPSAVMGAVVLWPIFLIVMVLCLVAGKS